MPSRQDKYRRMQDGELIAAVKGGDDHAFDALFLRWYPQVEKFLFSLVHNLALAEDLAQSVFMKLWICRDRLDPAKSLKNYLFVLARNSALDVFKSKRHIVMADTATPPEKAAPDSAEHKAEYREANSRILRLVDDMPPQRRQIFRMSRYQQLSSEEIAEKLGISVRTVEKHIQLALQDLRKSLN